MEKMTSNAAIFGHLKAISAGVLLAWSIPSHALTLGKFQTQSAMGEPLRAEIEITQFTQDELRGLQAQLASPNTFKQAGMEFNPGLQGVGARIESRAEGRAVIVLNGHSPIQDSFIDLILEAQTPTSKVVKNYALLLNATSSGSRPQNTSASARAPVQTEAISSPVQLSSTTDTSITTLTPSAVELNADRVPVYRFDNPNSSPAKAVTAPRNAMDTAVTPVAPKASSEAVLTAGDTLTVNPGDTASKLLLDHLPAGLSLEQMMLAAVRANPNAFIEGNVNLVRSGTVLRIPKREEAAQISREQARDTVLAQNRDFAAYARRLAGSPLLVGSAESREMSGTVSKAEPQAPESAAKQDKLTLSKAQLGNNSEEAQLAAERESKDAAEQLNALKKNMDDLQAMAKGAQAEASTPLPSTANSDMTLLDQMGQNKSVWTWALGALLALLALVFWSRRTSNKAEAIFAPSYDDISQPASVTETSTHIPQQITDIDLNLDPSPEPQVQATAPAIDHVTEQNKLALASQLLNNGDKELARTLISSVASTASGDLKARALQMLGQIA